MNRDIDVPVNVAATVRYASAESTIPIGFSCSEEETRRVVGLVYSASVEAALSATQQLLSDHGLIVLAIDGFLMPTHWSVRGVAGLDLAGRYAPVKQEPGAAEVGLMCDSWVVIRPSATDDFVIEVVAVAGPADECLLPDPLRPRRFPSTRQVALPAATLAAVGLDVESQVAFRAAAGRVELFDARRVVGPQRAGAR